MDSNIAFDVAEFLALDEDKQFAYQQELKAIKCKHSTISKNLTK